MPLSGAELGVELNELYDAGKRTLPSAGAQVAVARSHNNPLIGSIFSRPAGIGLGADGPFAAWSRCAQDLDDILGKSVSALDDTGTALMVFVRHMAETDAGARDELHRLGAPLQDL